MPMSIVDSMEGSISEEAHEKLLNLPNSLDSALVLNQALQVKVNRTIQRLNQVLRENLHRQVSVVLIDTYEF